MAKDHNTEIWKPVPGYRWYEASNLGRVRSLPRGGEKRPWRIYGGKVLNPVKGSSGYLMVRLTCDGKGRTMAVHQAVLLAFAGERPDGNCCCHNDGNRFNNHSTNLRYDSYSSNSLDRILHGTNVDGERNGWSKLSDKDRKFIILSRLRLIEKLAKKFNVTAGCIREIFCHDNRRK